MSFDILNPLSDGLPLENCNVLNFPFMQRSADVRILIISERDSSSADMP